MPVGEPPKLNILLPSWLLPAKLNMSPTAPEGPEPNAVIDTKKSNSANALNVSFVPAVNVISPLDVNVPVNCLLTLKLVSDTPELEVVFKVLIVW